MNNEVMEGKHGTDESEFVKEKQKEIGSKK